MDYEQAVENGELVALKRERDKAQRECKAAFRALQQSKKSGTWTEQTSIDYWQGPFQRFQVLEAQMLGVSPIQRATIDGLCGLRAEGE